MTRFLLPAVSLALLAGAASAAAQPPPPPASPPARPADVAVTTVIEPNRGGKPADGDLWREGRAIAVDTAGSNAADVVITQKVIANTPIPDSVENRRKFGQPLSHGGRRTAPRPGPVG